MKTDNNFVRSGRERIPDDNYQTIDPRCVLALVSLIDLKGSVCDVCSPNGSGIVDALKFAGVDSFGVGDAFVDQLGADWVVSNPPYKRGIVDKIINAQLLRLGKKEIGGVAMLLRTQFDHAKSRWNMFAANTTYAGQIKMLFRPKWFEDGDAVPIHNFVWHIWGGGYKIPGYPPRVWYWKEY